MVSQYEHGPDFQTPNEAEIADQAATITALCDRVAEVERERDEARKELDERLEDLGLVIMACQMSPETRTAPAHLGVRVMRTRLDAAEAAIARLRDEGAKLERELRDVKLSAQLRLDRLIEANDQIEEQAAIALHALQESDNER